MVKVVKETLAVNKMIAKFIALYIDREEKNPTRTHVKIGVPVSTASIDASLEDMEKRGHITETNGLQLTTSGRVFYDISSKLNAIHNHHELNDMTYEILMGYYELKMRHNKPPSQLAIRKHLGLQSSINVHYHLRNLKQKGYINERST